MRLKFKFFFENINYINRQTNERIKKAKINLHLNSNIQFWIYDDNDLIILIYQVICEIENNNNNNDEYA